MIESYIPQEYLQYFKYFPDVQKVTNAAISLTPFYTYGLACYGIHKKKSSVGFSIDICASMLVASILRILYYALYPYEISLLRQSISMVIVQLLLLSTSIRYRPSDYSPDTLAPLPDLADELAAMPKVLASPYSFDQPEFHSLLASNILQICKAYFKQLLRLFDVHYKRPGYFWQWVDPSMYWGFLAKFTVFFSLATVLFRHSDMYASFIGFSGLFVESLLPLPQILLLHRLKSVSDFRVILLVSWLGGDCLKLSYLFFGTDNISLIFIVAALFQMSLDITILCQYVHYRFRDKAVLEIPLYNTHHHHANAPPTILPQYPSPTFLHPRPSI